MLSGRVSLCVVGVRVAVSITGLTPTARRGVVSGSSWKAADINFLAKRAELFDKAIVSLRHAPIRLC